MSLLNLGTCIIEVDKASSTGSPGSKLPFFPESKFRYIYSKKYAFNYLCLPVGFADLEYPALGTIKRIEL